jgi:hypothetical protein
MTNDWKKAILENVPHGEEGYICLPWEDAITWAKILSKRGYAVLFTGGEMEDEVKVSWLYAGDSDNLDWADYDNVVFTNVDYIDEYPAAYYGKCGDENDDEGDEEDK